MQVVHKATNHGPTGVVAPCGARGFTILWAEADKRVTCQECLRRIGETVSPKTQGRWQVSQEKPRDERDAFTITLTKEQVTTLVQSLNTSVHKSMNGRLEARSQEERDFYWKIEHRASSLLDVIEALLEHDSDADEEE